MPVEDYFVVSTWKNGYPVEEGSLANDNWDPSFGDGGLSIGRDVYLCLFCGAGVLDWEIHIQWHDSQENK